MRELIIDMANKNIGSLCIFLKNTKNIIYLEFLNNNIPLEISDRSLSEKIYYFVNEQKDLLLCECGKHLSFIGFKNGYRVTCGDKSCSVKKRRETCVEKWGVDNPKKSKDIIEKEKINILNKWGGKHYMLDDNIQKKFKETMILNWGVEWAQQSKDISDKSKSSWNLNPRKEEIIEKRSETFRSKSTEEKNEIFLRKKETIIQNWGSINQFYTHVNNKIKEKSKKNWGVEHHLSHPDIIEKRTNKYKETVTNKIKSKLPNDIVYISRQSNSNNTDNIISLKCLVCNNEFYINRQYLVSREKINRDICLKCNPRLSGKSLMESELFKFISENYNGEIKTSDKNVLSGREIDIFLPNLNLAFEFNGLYWHSELHKESNYHQKKTKDCIDLGIELIHIWEDDWLYKNEIVKSIILNKLELSTKIWARKCKIKHVDNIESRQFLNDNHIQGFVGSKIKLGLYYNEELVSLMTFGSLRRSLGYDSKEGYWELLRFCNKSGYSVVGGASKLLKYFINNNYIKSIISYSDNSRGVGNLYKKLNFKFIHETPPNYYYVINNIRMHRFNFRKDKLIKDGFDIHKTEVEIMNERGFLRVFDCGSKKWELLL